MNSVLLFSVAGFFSVVNYCHAYQYHQIVKNCQQLTDGSNPNYYYYTWKPTTNFPLRIGYDVREFLTREDIIECNVSVVNGMNIKNKLVRINKQHIDITNDISNNFFTTGLLTMLHNKYSIPISQEYTNDTHHTVTGVPLGDQYTVIGYYNGQQFVNNNMLRIEKDKTIENIVDEASDYVTISMVLNAIVAVSGFAYWLLKNKN